MLLSMLLSALGSSGEGITVPVLTLVYWLGCHMTGHFGSSCDDEYSQYAQDRHTAKSVACICGSSTCFLSSFSHTFLTLQISTNTSLVVLRRRRCSFSSTALFYSTADAGKPTLLISLDLSAAFDTIDYTLLFKRLSYSFGIAGSVHSWIQSYLTDRTQSVHIGSHSSPVTSCPVGVPQGSVLGPLLFFDIHVTYFHDCWVTPSSSAAVYRRHAALPGFVAYSSYTWYFYTSVLFGLSSHLGLWKWHGPQRF